MLETLFDLDALHGDARLRLDDDITHVIAAPRAGGAARPWRVLPLPVLELARTIHFDDVDLVYTATRARFVLGGEDRWTIDVARFAGAPVLSVHKDSDALVRIGLAGARYPGTQIPADLEARIVRHRTLGWALELRLSWGGFSATVGLRGFLDGSARATAPVALGSVAVPLDAAAAIAVEGLGVATFFPSWLLAAAGPKLARLSGFGDVVVRHGLAVALLAPDMVGVMRDPPERRSAVFVGLDGAFALDFWSGAGGLDFAATDPPFRRLAVEAGEDAGGPRRLLIAAGDRDSALEFGPSPDLRRSTGERARIALETPVFLALYDQTGTRRARGLVAGLAEQTRGLHTARLSLLVGRPRAHKRFVLGEIGDQRALVCELEWRAHAARPGGLVAAPLPAADDTRVRIVLDGAPPSDPAIGEIRVTPGQPHVEITAPVGLFLRFVRARDLLVFLVHLVGLRLVARGPDARLVRAAASARLVVHLPAQAIGEQAIDEEDDDIPEVTLPPPPIPAYIAGGSRLAFAVAAGTDALTFDLAHLLDWTAPQLAPNLAPAARPAPAVGPPPPIRAPEFDETAIEAPLRLVLSPDGDGAWTHSLAPVERAGVAELWHTRLVRRATRGGVRRLGDPDPKIRAIWTPGYPDPPDNPGSMVMSLRSIDRRDIVTQSVRSAAPTADLVLLTALGAWLDLDAKWTDEALPLLNWTHRATMGRDHFVRVVRRGFLFPFGHRAALITITERKLQQKPAGRLGGYLRRRVFVVVREPEVAYLPGDAGRYPHAGRETPLARVRILDRITPILDVRPPVGDPDHTVFLPDDQGFWLRVGDADLPLRLRAWDRDGRQVDFTAPVAFVAQATSAAAMSGSVTAARGSHTAGPAARRTRPLAGQRLGFAASARPDDTAFEVESLTLDAHPEAWAPGDTHRPFYPFMTEAAVVLPALRHFGGADESTAIVYHPPYLAGGFDGKGDVFVAAKDPPALRFGGDRSTSQIGGLFTPSLSVGGVSRSLGLVGGGLDSLGAGTFDPATYFGTLFSADLLGGIKLRDILAGGLSFDPTAERGLVPKWRELVDGGRRRFALHWETDKFLAVAPFVPQGARLVVEAVAEVRADGAVDATTTAALTDFTVELFDVISIGVQRLAFVSKPGEKPDVDVRMGEVHFLGALGFVEKLTSYLDVANFADPPAIDVSPAGVKVGYTLAIPAITVGVFSLQNLRLDAAVTLPFDGGPLRARFALSSRDDPFTITVMIFGGGGYFAIAVGLDGVEALELLLEFGGNWALDFGVASGGVHAMAGIYIRIDAATETTALTGYVRAGGELSVLGIVSVSLELYLGLTYENVGGAGKAWGEASMTIEVEVLFFSVGFTATARREFSGSSHSPTFHDALAPDAWADYCAAFAA